MINNIREEARQIMNYLIIVFVFYFPIASIYSQQNLDIMHQITNILIYITLFVGLTVDKIKYLFQNKVFLATLGLSALLLISLMWSESHIGCFYGHPEYYKTFFKSYFLLPFLIIVFILKKEFIPILINTFLASMFINEIISYGIYFNFWDTWAGSRSNPVPFHLNHITYSTYIGLAILLSLYKLINISNRYFKAFYLMFFITMSINLFMSSGRTGQMSLLITSFILIFIYFKKDIRKIITLIFSLFIIFIVMYHSVDTFNERVDRAKKEIIQIIHGESDNLDTSFGTRIMAFDTISYLINRNNIIFGVGIGDKPTYVSETLSSKYPYRLMNFDKHGYLHNSHLEILVSNGVIGLFIYLMLFYSIFKVNIQDKFLKYISYVVPTYFFCYGMSADIFFFHHVTLLFAIMIAIVVVQKQFEDLEKS